VVDSHATSNPGISDVKKGKNRIKTESLSTYYRKRSPLHTLHYEQKKKKKKKKTAANRTHRYAWYITIILIIYFFTLKKEIELQDSGKNYVIKNLRNSFFLSEIEKSWAS